MLEIFIRFLILGCMSFGGPVAHIAYFQREFVEKRKWITEKEFASAFSLCQFLPGPASSQLGMFIGYHRGGYAGSFLAFLGFTFPSFALLTTAAFYNAQWGRLESVALLIQAAKLLAVVVVADAIWNMGRQFITNVFTFLVCFASAGWTLWQSGLLAQVIPILLAGVLGWLFVTHKKRASIEEEPIRTPSAFELKKSVFFFAIFIILLVLPVFIQTPLSHLFQHFYQAGSFVFGGGHVVLPLLQPLIGNAITESVLLEGYAAAQLVPGPMFTIASYIGASVEGVHPFLGSLVATLAVFFPGALLLFSALPLWEKLMAHKKFSGSIVLINAAVVGLLVSAFYQPIWVSAVRDPFDILILLFSFVLLRRYRLSVFVLLAGICMSVFARYFLQQG